MKGKWNGFSFFMLFVALMVFAWLIPSGLSVAYGEDEERKKNLPPRAISIAPEYTGVIVTEGDDVSLDIKVKNGGQSDENIELTIPKIPEGWKARIKTYSYDITGAHIPSDSTKSLTLRAEPFDGVGPGKYTFSIRAQSQDGELTSSAQVTISVKAGEKKKETKDVRITTSYPVLRGPTDAKFEFSLEVENKTDKDSIFNLISEGPKNWEINFKPAYEEKFISSLRIKKGQSQSMGVEVKPFVLAAPGKYPIIVKVSSEDGMADVNLMVLLTGTNKLDVGTPDGLLSLNAMRGKEANLSFYVKNSGSAPQSNIRFLSFKPENWKVEYKPELIETIAPGELKQIEAIITPAEQALVGDYSVGLNVDAGKFSKDMELRVTVRASTAWGWIGIGIIVLVVLGLVVLFVRMGRR